MRKDRKHLQRYKAISTCAKAELCDRALCASHHVHCQHAGMIVIVATLSAKPGNWSGSSVGCVPSSHKQPGVSNSIYNGSCTRGNSRRSGLTLSTRASATQELCGALRAVDSLLQPPPQRSSDKLSAEQFARFFREKVESMRLSTATADPPVIATRRVHDAFQLFRANHRNRSRQTSEDYSGQW